MPGVQVHDAVESPKARYGTHFETMSQGPRLMTAAGSTSISTAKQQLREQLRARRRALSPAQREAAARRVTQALLRSHWFRQARRIGIYLHTGSELSTAVLIRAAQRSAKRLYAPCIGRDGRMEFRALTAADRLRRNRHGISEPLGRRFLPPKQLDLLLIPLLGFDDRGQRLGAGGGYYDRYLQRCGRFRPLRIGLAYSLQRIARLPVEAWDLPLHAVVTEVGLQRFTPT